MNRRRILSGCELGLSVVGISPQFQVIALKLATRTNKNAVIRNHVDADLKPFVCCSEECETTATCFSTIRDWRAHMEDNHRQDWVRYVYRVQWKCPHCNDDDQPFFPTEEALARHLTGSDDSRVVAHNHPTLPKGVELDKVLIRSKSYKLRKVGECPLCCEPSNSSPELSESARNSETEQHLAGHLLDLAF